MPISTSFRRVIAALLLALCSLAATTAQAATEITARIWITNTPAGLTTNLSINIGAADTRDWTNNAAGAPSTSIQITNSIAASRTNLYRHLSDYRVYSAGATSPRLEVSLNPTNTAIVDLVAPMNTNITVTFGGNWAYVVYETNSYSDSAAILIRTNTMSATARTNAENALVNLLAVGRATNSIPTNTPAFRNYTDTNSPQTVANKTLVNPVLQGGRWVGVTNLTGTNGALTNLTLHLAVITGGDFTGIITAVSNGIIYATVLDGVRPTNVYGLAGAIHQLIGGQWTNGTLQTPTLISPSLSNATIFGNTTITGATLNLIGSGVNNFISLTATSTIAAVGPIFYMARENGITNAVDAGDVLGLIGFTGWGTTAQKVGARIRAIPMETFTDSTAGTILLFETTPSGSTTPVGRLHIGNDGFITLSNMLQVVVAVTNLTVAGTNKWQGDLSYSRYSNSGIINGNNSGILIGTNVVVELSGGTTIAQYAGFVASRDGDYRIVRMSGAVTNVIVDANDPIWSPDGTAARRITTGTGGALLLTNQPSWIKMMYRTASTSWEVLDHSR